MSTATNRLIDGIEELSAHIDDQGWGALVGVDPSAVQALADQLEAVLATVRANVAAIERIRSVLAVPQPIDMSRNPAVAPAASVQP